MENNQIKCSNREWFENFSNFEQYFKDENTYHSNNKNDAVNSGDRKESLSLINKSNSIKVQQKNYQD